MDSTSVVNHVVFLETIGIPNFLRLFHCVMLEKKIIVMGFSMSQISNAVESLSALLEPFHWHHTLVPLLPYHLVNIIEAPTPYIIGIHDSEHFDNDILESLDDVTVIHLNHENPLKSESCKGCDNVLIPNMMKTLWNRLEVIKELSVEEPEASVLNVMISEAFTKFF